MLEKAMIVVQETAQKIPVMYNPTELTDTLKVNTSRQDNNIQFGTVTRDNFTVSLFFDTYEKGTDVRKETGKIQALLKPSEGSGDRKEPPVCMFTWSDVWYTGIITELNQQFTMFLSSGIPVRATIKVTFESVLTAKEELQALGLYNCRKLYQVSSGDRLDLIAYRETGNSEFWREIAAANDIDDPLYYPSPLQTGSFLVIPDYHQQE